MSTVQFTKRQCSKEEGISKIYSFLETHKNIKINTTEKINIADVLRQGKGRCSPLSRIKIELVDYTYKGRKYQFYFTVNFDENGKCPIGIYETDINVANKLQRFTIYGTPFRNYQRQTKFREFTFELEDIYVAMGIKHQNRFRTFNIIRTERQFKKIQNIEKKKEQKKRDKSEDEVIVGHEESSDTVPPRKKYISDNEMTEIRNHQPQRLMTIQEAEFHAKYLMAKRDPKIAIEARDVWIELYGQQLKQQYMSFIEQQAKIRENELEQKTKDKEIELNIQFEHNKNALMKHENEIKKNIFELNELSKKLKQENKEKIIDEIINNPKNSKLFFEASVNKKMQDKEVIDEATRRVMLIQQAQQRQPIDQEKLIATWTEFK